MNKKTADGSGSPASVGLRHTQGSGAPTPHAWNSLAQGPSVRAWWGEVAYGGLKESKRRAFCLLGSRRAGPMELVVESEAFGAVEGRGRLFV